MCRFTRKWWGGFNKRFLRLPLELDFVCEMTHQNSTINNYIIQNHFSTIGWGCSPQSDTSRHVTLNLASCYISPSTFIQCGLSPHKACVCLIIYDLSSHLKTRLLSFKSRIRPVSSKTDGVERWRFKALYQQIHIPVLWDIHKIASIKK